MARNRNRNRSLGSSQLFERAQRELAKGNAKTALKDAEACFRQDACQEHRHLLEQVYVGRVEQLHRQGLPAEALAVLRKLIDFKPSDPDILGRIPRLQLVVGDRGVDAASLLEQDPGLLVSLADQAVLDPRSPAPHHGGVAAHVEQIRKAFAAVERGDDDAAAEALRSVPHNSPLRDWNLFVRGLSPFYLKEIERAEANWARLDMERPAFRIAQTLLAAVGRVRPTDAKVDVTECLAFLHARLQTDPAAGPLKNLAQYWREGDWQSFFREFRAFRQRFAKICPSLLAKIVELVWRRAAHEGDSSILERLAAISPPPPLDPRWNRAWALGAEGACDVRPSALEEGWLAYIEDLSTAACLRDEERSIAVGLVHHRLATTLLRLAAIADKPRRFPWDVRDPGEGDKLRANATRHLRRAVESCPRLTKAYWDLARLHEEQDEPEKSASVLRRLIGVVQDDFDAHLWLANYYLGRTEPGESEPHVDEALRLRPRDPQCSTLRRNQQIAAIRSLAVRRKFEEARRQIDEAVHVMGEGDAEPFAIDVMRAALELKAKNRDASEQHLASALQTAGEPAAVWLAMSATAAEFRVPRNVAKEYETRLEAALRARPTSRTAGLLARLLDTLKTAKRNYTGRATQERIALKYLDRARRIEWAEADLLAVCRFLKHFAKYAPLRALLVAAGLKKFPANGCLCYWAAMDELAKGRRRCCFNRVIRQLRQAIELLQTSDSVNDRSLIQLAKEALSTAYENRQRQEPWREFISYDEDDCDEHDDDEDDEDDDYEDDDDEDDDDEYDEMGFRSNKPGSHEEQLDLFGDGGIASSEIRAFFADQMKDAPPDVVEAFERLYKEYNRKTASSR